MPGTMPGMATITSRAFLAGATVNAYARDTLPGRAPNAYTGASLGSGVVDAAGAVTIGGLAAESAFVLTDGTKRVVASTLTDSTTSGTFEATGVVAPPATGIAAIDTAALLACIAQTITLYGPDGGPVYLPPTNAVTPYRLTSTGTLTLPKAGALIGSGSGGRSLDGGAGLPDRVCTKIDASLITAGVAIEYGTAGTYQKVQGIFLAGPSAATATASRTGGSVGVRMGYYSLFATLRDVYITGFSNQVVGQNAKHFVIEDVHGKISGTHGCAMIADGGEKTNGTIRGSLFADSGQNPGVVATTRPGNIYLENAEHTVVDCENIDECVNGSSSVYVAGLSEDVEIRVPRIYVGNGAGNVGVRIGDGTNAVQRTQVRAARVVPYNTAAPASAGVVIAAGAVDTVLEGVTTDYFAPGNHVQDAGARTRYGDGTDFLTGTVRRTAGLVAWWRLGDRRDSTVAVDEKGVSNGVYSSTGATVPLPTRAEGPARAHATRFRGAGQYVTVPHVAGLNVGDTFTVKAWVRRTSVGQTQTVLVKGNNSAQLRFAADDTIEFLKAAVATVGKSTATVTDGVFHEVAITKTGATSKIYLDGVDVSGVMTNQTIADTAGALLIGADTAAAGNPMIGDIAEVQIYNVALDAATMLAHYKARGV